MEAVKRKTASVISKIVGLLLAAVFILPVIILLLNVCKPLGEILSNPFSLPTSFYLDNIVYVIENMNYPRMLGNTIFCAVLVVVISVIISAMCGYKLSRTNDKKSKILLSVLMAAMMLPFQSIMLPISRVANTLHLNDSLLGYIVIVIPYYVPFAVFLYHGFVKGIPQSLEESAVVDGCPPLKMFFKIIFPLMTNVTASIVVLFTLWVWNDFLLPSILLRSSDKKLLTTSIFSFFSAFYMRWDYSLAALFLSITPITIFYLFMQKYFVSGIVAGAVKG